MASILRRVFNLRPHEWRQFLILYAMFFVFVVGITWAENTLYGAVVEQGVQFLPPVQIGSAVVALLITGIYAAFVDRIPNDKLLTVIAIVCVIVVALGLVLLTLNLRAVAFPLLYLLQQVIDGIVGLHWWTYAISLYDTRTAKRILPLLASSGRVGAAVAGFTYRILTGPLALTVAGIIVLWLASLVAVPFMTRLMPKLGKEGSTPSFTPVSTSPTISYVGSLRDGYRFVISSPFLRWMALSAFLIMIIAKFMEYQAGAIFRHEFANAENVNVAISNFTADLTGITNLLMLLAQLFLFNRLITRIGLGNANLIYPIATLGVTGTLIFLPASLLTGALGHFNRTSFRQVFRSPIDNLLFNAVPLRVKGRARAFINGLIVPVGVIVAGGLLSLVSSVTTPWLLPALLGIAVIAYAITAFVIRRKYTQALVTMLEQEDFSFLLSQPSELAAADPATVKWLTQRLEDSKRDDLTIFLAGILLQVGGNAVVPTLGQAAGASSARVRAAILELIVAADIPGDAVYILYKNFLADEDGRVRRAAVAGLEECLGPRHPEFLSLAVNLLPDDELEIRSLVILALLRSNGPAHTELAAQSLTELLAKEDPLLRAQGIRILGQVTDPQFGQLLLTYLTDSVDNVRLEAALAIETVTASGMTNPISNYVLENKEALLTDPVERIRQAILTLLGTINTKPAHEAIIGALADSSPVIRQVALDKLQTIGKPAIPMLIASLKSPNRQFRKMVSVSLSQINPDEFENLLSDFMQDNLDAAYNHSSQIQALSSYTQYPSISVLQVTLRERIGELLDDIFYLLTIHHDPEDIDIISDSLKSDNLSARANAIEALESLTSPQIARDIAPLFDHELAGVRRNNKLVTTDAKQTIRHLLTPDSDVWLRAIATFALGEIGVGASPENQNSLKSAFLPAEIRRMLTSALSDPSGDVRLAAYSAHKKLFPDVPVPNILEEKTVLSAIEKIIFLKEVSFFQNMSMNQLKVLADICEEVLIEEGEQLFNQGDPGGALYVVVNGKIGIGVYSKHSGAFTKLSTIETRQAFGEMALFDNAPRSAAAVALQHSLLLLLRREPLIALARQFPDLSLELITVLSHRLRQANDQIASFSSSLRRPVT
jgi:HEAT repeat protein